MSPAFGGEIDKEVTRSAEPVPTSEDGIIDTVENMKKTEKVSEQIKLAIKNMILNKALSWHPEGLQKLAMERKKLKETLFVPKV